VGPRASPDILEKTQIFIPTTIQTLNHPDGEINTVHTTTPWLTKYHPTTGHDGQPQPFYSLERNPVPLAQEAG